MILWRNIEKLSIVIIFIPTPDFPNFYYMLGGNLGSLLYGDVSMMIRIHNACLCRIGKSHPRMCVGVEFQPVTRLLSDPAGEVSLSFINTHDRLFSLTFWLF